MNRRAMLVPVAILALIMALPAQALTTDKQRLYDKYPQLVSDSTDACIKGLSQVLINMATQSAQAEMVLSSMHGLNDLGSEGGCENGSMADWATFTTLNINVTHIPISLISGLCLPKECSQSDLSQFSHKVTTGINNLLIMLQEKFHIIDFSKGYGLVKPYTRVEVELNHSEEAAEDWQDDMRVGYICALTFVGLCFAGFCLFPNIYWLVMHFKANGPSAEDAEEASVYRS